jgi:hypothetical protein
MRSLDPIPGNPWPHDMVIRIENDLQQVMDLLWVREAYGLHPVGDAPPSLIDTPERSGSPDDVPGGEAAWPGLWQAVLDHAGGLDATPLLERLHRTGLDPAERAELLAGLFGPSWRDRFGDAAFDDRYRAWTERRFRDRTRDHARTLAETPERRSLAALVPAWEAGLVKIVTIPCHGEHTRRIGDATLLMTDATRDDPERYTAALSGFR